MRNNLGNMSHAIHSNKLVSPKIKKKVALPKRIWFTEHLVVIWFIHTQPDDKKSSEKNS